MLFFIPIIGPIFGFILMCFFAIPFYFLWNALAPVYFYWLPQVYHTLPFWHCVGLLMLVFMLKLVLFPIASGWNK